MSYAPRVYGTGYERFVPKVEIDRETGCWNWTASTTPGGYGSLSLPNGERCVAHRFSYEHHVGPIPDGLQIDHLVPQPALRQPGALGARHAAREHSARRVHGGAAGEADTLQTRPRVHAGQPRADGALPLVQDVPPPAHVRKEARPCVGVNQAMSAPVAV